MAGNVTEAEIKEAARKIRDWCQNHNCWECCFCHGRDEAVYRCDLENDVFKDPGQWEIE